MILYDSKMKMLKRHDIGRSNGGGTACGDQQRGGIPEVIAD